MQSSSAPPFLRGKIDGVHWLVSVWLRNLEEVEETVQKWAADLPVEGFWWVPAPEANAIGGLIRHIGGASYRLLLRGTGQEIPEPLRVRAPEELVPTGQDPKAVLAEFSQNLEKVRAALRLLGDQDLQRTVRVGPYEAPAVYVLDHIAAHAQHHAGQIITTRKLWNAR
ncbi:DinB family protein [Meiothermus sp. CFH 77666]|uniref:DinB family protein n=1 Tax=Meiothermus sp. CFH 77666 TaxID=2817942 RepID=UPI001AA0A63E|nr:DinB family protein [Meiothermus sp. CFH 77666]MBO1436753.1 DinB family protein [Meiothermus sp. CFH 77666]